MNTTKLPNSHKALIKDLELQIDFLIGYRPSGLHWKREYHLRKLLLEETLASSTTPQEIVDKIARIQNSLASLYEKEPHKQGYLAYTQQDYVQGKILHAPIKVTEWINGQQVIRYIAMQEGE